MSQNNQHNDGLFIISYNGDPEFNMASDEWLFDNFSRYKSRYSMIVKLYTWNRPAITFGFNQKLEKTVNFDLIDDTFPVIRRMTGGRAIYHDNSELTLTVIIDLESLPENRRNISSTNAMISDILVLALENSDIHTNWAKVSDSKFKESVGSNMKACFDSMSKYEITDGISKIAAGAQRIIDGKLLHQGALKINGITACPAINQKDSHASSEINLEISREELERFAVSITDSFFRKEEINFKKREFLDKEMNEIGEFSKEFANKLLEKR